MNSQAPDGRVIVWIYLQYIPTLSGVL